MGIRVISLHLYKAPRDVSDDDYEQVLGRFDSAQVIGAPLPLKQMKQTKLLFTVDRKEYATVVAAEEEAEEKKAAAAELVAAKEILESSRDAERKLIDERKKLRKSIDKQEKEL